MDSLSDMKSKLVTLEDKVDKLKEEFQTADRRFKQSLWGVGVGVLLLPLYWFGIPVLLLAGGMAVYCSVKKASCKDKLQSLESEIHKLEISMP